MGVFGSAACGGFLPFGMADQVAQVAGIGYRSIMELTSEDTFDAISALEASSVASRLQATHHQSSLDITEKERTSVLPWRGQFSPQLVEFLLSEHTKTGETILDPFCGSGTVLFEAAHTARNAYGYDVNPAANCLAKVSSLLALDTASRNLVMDSVGAFVSLLRQKIEKEQRALEPNDAVQSLRDFGASEDVETALVAFLLLSFGNVRSADQKKIIRAESAIKRAIFSFPKHDGKVFSDIGDARYMPLEDDSIDYILTSPPYINVFNYHQNYRPIVEALGYLPLSAARSEVGANRKFRQNRYMTAVQYCMDMSLFLAEAARVVRPNGEMTIVLGRESNIRSVAFKNGELISAIAVEGLGFDLKSWHERKFLNRFGESIFEDILTVRLKSVPYEQSIEVGRAVGAQVLRNALKYCSEERAQEIEAAVEAAPKIEISPRIER